MDRRNYSEIRAELAAANEWLSRLGIREQQDRIRLHMRRIAQLEEAWRAGGLVEATRGEEGRLAMFSLTEALEFLAVYRAFGHGHPAALPDRIAESLDGPADLQTESERSNRGRNVMFELNLASRLKLQGLPIDELPVNPDILTRLGEVPLYFQCKRPLKQETIRDNIENAEKQLTRDLDGASNTNARGIIAISVSRAFNVGNQLFVGPELNGLKESLGGRQEARGREPGSRPGAQDRSTSPAR
jgi:hypothetical protein